MRSNYLPGWLLLALIAGCSIWLSSLYEVSGKHPLEASVISIVLGILIRNLRLLPLSCEPGTQASEKLLVFGIVLMGAALDVAQIVAQGIPILVIVLITMVIGYISIYYLGRLLHLSDAFSILLAVGTTICGTSAIAVTAPLIHSKDEETSYSVATIALWGLVAIFLYPPLARAFSVSDLAFGIFAGTAIHSTPQVVGAGFLYSDLAGKTATAVKLVRNCFMAPLAILIGVWFSKKSVAQNFSYQQLARSFPWFLFGYFVMAYCNTKGYFTPSGAVAFAEAGKVFILFGMAGVGLNTEISSCRTVGFKPLVVGFLGALIVAVLSGSLIALIF